MFQIYFCIGTVILSMALSIGLIFSLTIMPDETTHEQIYLFAGKIAGAVMLVIALLIYFLKKAGYIKIEKNLI